MGHQWVAVQTIFKKLFININFTDVHMSLLVNEAEHLEKIEVLNVAGCVKVLKGILKPY